MAAGDAEIVGQSPNGSESSVPGPWLELFLSDEERAAHGVQAASAASSDIGRIRAASAAVPGGVRGTQPLSTQPLVPTSNTIPTSLPVTEMLIGSSEPPGRLEKTLTCAALDLHLKSLRAEFTESLAGFRNEFQSEMQRLKDQLAAKEVLAKDDVIFKSVARLQPVAAAVGDADEFVQELPLSPGQEIIQDQPIVIQAEESEEAKARALARRPDQSGIEEIMHSDEAQYTLDLSMWDAALFLFVRKNSLVDTCMLIFGLSSNLVLQGLLFLVVVYNMLENGYDEAMVSEMVKWRVEHGHSNDAFDMKSGDSRAAKLCRGQLWSYESTEFESMYSYLYKPIPGHFLSILAIILWVLTSMTEFRRVVDQATAVFKLPVVNHGEHGIKKSEGDTFEVVGIYRGTMPAFMVLLILPRLLLNIGLTLAGCRYLAQTSTLSDIVLNAVALAFVMDVDELLVHVFLSDKMRLITSKVQPIPCDMQRSCLGCIKFQDLLRFIATAAFIIFTIWFWLAPFALNVRSAATALCGGNLNFSYSGGKGFDVTIMPTLDIRNDFLPFCDAQTNRTYHRKYYPDLNFQPQPVISSSLPDVNSSVAWYHDVLKYVFSFSDCGPGKVRAPPKAANVDSNFFKALFGNLQLTRKTGPRKQATYNQGDCSEIPLVLADVLPREDEHGKNPFPTCPRFDVSLGEDACTKPDHPGVCLWSWEAQFCEGQESPGIVFQDACQSDLWKECRTWERLYSANHPFRNCEITRYCSPSFPRCLVMSGWLEVTVVDVTTIVNNASAFSQALVAASSIFDISQPWALATFELVFFKDGNRKVQIAPELELIGVWHVHHSKKFGKAWHVRTNQFVANLSAYGMGSANNGGGTDGVEYRFPNISVPAGAHILISRDKDRLASYLGSCTTAFYAILESDDEPTGNGDDAVELFYGDKVIETYGNANVDGTGEAWEYTGSWAYKDSTGRWVTAALECAASSNRTETSDCPYPHCLPRCTMYPCPSTHGLKPHASQIIAFDLAACCDFNEIVVQCRSFVLKETCPDECIWSGTMCSRPAEKCGDAKSDCVMVRYELQGVSEHLRTFDVVNSSNRLTDELNLTFARLGHDYGILSASYNVSSIQFSALTNSEEKSFSR